MQRQTLLIVLAAAMLVLAGCGGATSGGATDGTTDGDASDGADGSTGTVQFYVSDQPTAISEFEHLNVTITQVGFERADGDAGDDEDGTATPNATVTPGDDPAEDGEDGQDGQERAGWVTRDIEDRTVDPTRLQGDNATLVGTPQIPAGNYTKVFVHVDSVEATLGNGESANVKLPSGRLQLTRGFTLEPNGTVQFVYDISVVKAGNSGKYILKPVISESGPGKDVTVVTEDPDDEDRDDEESDDEQRVIESITGTQDTTRKYYITS